MTAVRRAALRALCLVASGALACSSASSPPGGLEGAVAVAISPLAVTLPTSGQQLFQANVSGTSNVSVTWVVAEGDAGGTVTASGAYTAPATEGSYHVVVTSVADTTKSAVARVIVTSATQDLCAGLVQDKLPHPMTAVPKPGVGEAYVDPEFGTTVRRISDAAAHAVNVVKPMYSTVQAWNADESYLILYHTDGAPAGHHLYDGRTYAYIKELDIRPADLEQVYWDATDPKILYYTDIVTHQLHRFDVETDTHETSTVLRDFSDAPVGCADDITGGSDPMWTSWDSRFLGYTCGRTTQKLFTYDLVTGTVGTIVTLSAGGNAPQPAPSGDLFYLNVNGAAQVRDANLTLLRTLSVNADEHASLGTSDGIDTLFSVQFDGAVTGSLVATDLTTGANRVIVGETTGYPYPPTGTHISAIAYQRPGWVAVDVVGNTDGPGLLDEEILLVNANAGGTVCRVAHHHSCGSTGQCGTQGYWAEPHNVISPSGTRILFGSDWGGEPRVETYVVELPGYTPPRN